MVRSLFSLGVLAFFAASVALADEKPKAPAPPAKPAAAVKAPAAKPAVPPKAQPALSPQAKRIADMKAAITAARTKAGEAQNEARKLREQANAAESKATAMKRDVEFLEKSLVETIARTDAETKEAAVRKIAQEKAQAEAKRWDEMTKKVMELEREVKGLTMKLEAAAKKPAAAKAVCPKPEKKPEKKPEAPKKK